MTELNASIRDIPIPARMARRPISNKGFPVPYFVTHRDADGNYDFRMIDGRTIANCVNKKLCWLCGEPLGQYKAFVIGPMCAFNRVSSEPPSHRECALYGILACPHLSHPNAKRNDTGLTDEDRTRFVGGIGLNHNPGVSLLWVTKTFKPFRANGVLFELGDPTELHFYKERRIATRAEIDHSIFEIGLPKVRAVAEAEGPEAIKEFERSVARGMKLLPAA
jgi:hypothetical protein